MGLFRDLLRGCFGTGEARDVEWVSAGEKWWPNLSVSTAKAMKGRAEGSS